MKYCFTAPGAGSIRPLRGRSRRVAAAAAPPPPRSQAAAANAITRHCRSPPDANCPLSDVHGNLPAFEACSTTSTPRAPRRSGPRRPVGYGAQPDDCMALARERCNMWLTGNHDLVVTGEIRSRTSPERGRGGPLDPGDDRRGDDAYLKGLAPSTRREPALYHASPRDPVLEYVLSSWQADECIDLMDPPFAQSGTPTWHSVPPRGRRNVSGHPAHADWSATCRVATGS